MEARETFSSGETVMEDPADRERRRKLLWRRHALLLGVTALAVLLTLGTRWYLHFTNYPGLVVSSGLEVVRVLSDGPAARSGIRPGDRLLAIDRQPISNLTDYLRAVQAPGIKGREVMVSLRRGGEEIALPLSVTAYPILHLTGFGPACGLVVLLFGLTVHLRKPRDPASGLYLLLSTCLFVLLAFSNHLLKQTPSPLLFLLWGTALIAVVPLNLHFYLVFPERKQLVRSRPRILAGLYLLPAVFLIALVAIVAGLEWDLLRGLDSGPGFDRLRRLFLAYFVVGLVSCVAFVASLVHSLLRASSAEGRKQVEVLLTGAMATLLFAGLAVTGLAVYLTDPSAASVYPPWTFNALYAVIVLATIVLPLSMAVAILKYRLWDLDRTLHTSMNCTLLSAALLVLSLSALGFVGWVFGRVFEPTSYAAVLVFTLTVAALFDPLRHLVQRMTERALNPGAYAYRKTLGDFSFELATIRRIEPLTARLCETVSLALGANLVAIALEAGPGQTGWRIVASAGADDAEKLRLAEAAAIVQALWSSRPAGASTLRIESTSGRDEGRRQSLAHLRALGLALAVPIRSKGRLLGCIFLGPRSRFWSYTRDDRDLLETLANQLALAVVNAAAFETIQSMSHGHEEANRNLKAQLAKNEEQRVEILRLQEMILAENRYLKEEVEGEYDFRGIVGAAFGLKDVMDTVARAANSEATVLIRGETGTGKELIARAIHANSPRKDRPFIRANCAAFVGDVALSELFGHEKGAFTDAHERKQGRFELANRGTLFLDEVRDMPLPIQRALLRALQEGEFERVGGTETIRVDVRIIAATNQDLEREVAEGRFREDLYYRLAVVNVVVPALCERTRDIRSLALHFVQKHARRHGRSVLKIEDDVIECLKSYRWPGNVRELEHVIEQAVVLARADSLTLDDLPAAIGRGAPPGKAAQAAGGPAPASDRPQNAPADGDAGDGGGDPDGTTGPGLDEQSVAEIERERLVSALAKAEGNKSKAAIALGVSRPILYKRLKKHGLLK